ncbi:MAG: proline--tRNA ligase [Candidatus Omnitrophica bacterium CG11_big_fil_rev_8_21_14_0_20_64_10]|nr:MAG: proline--tRNA ligase [Candidatus Omnitrophica bacterium CG11_big_fil_rev_8_21_14_0_20_64_10]
MRWSETYIPTLKETPAEAEIASHRLMLRAGLIRKLAAGTYSYLPLGMRSLAKVTAIIREEMEAASVREVLLPALQPAELWKRSGRWETMGPEMIRFKNRHGRDTVLGPTHEEVITDLLVGEVRSYRDLPKNLYQIQTKFRDEPRPRFGVIRSCEFLMKDAYSFDRDAEALEKRYRRMFEAYETIFKRCGLNTIPVEADTGVMGGDDSHEFMVPAGSGEDTIVQCAGCGYAASKDRAAKKLGVEIQEGVACPKCKKGMKLLPAIEVGHIFKLGTKYSAALGAAFLDEAGQSKPIIMGCYGIGVTRLLPAIIETHHDEAGILWPVSVAPYPAVIVPLKISDPAQAGLPEQVERELTEAGVECLLDDREVSAGVKMKDADLIGFPIRILLSDKTLQKNSAEVKFRGEAEATLVPLTELLQQVKKRA